jgi:ABC-type multidrug transport system fused ATPase/permease subunit
MMCAIHQNVYLFEGTIRDNITLYKNYSEEEINEAVKLAELEKLVASLPKGLDTFIGENGSNLSGGERQRVSIARAIIKKTPIIILDEAFSKMDGERIQESIHLLRRFQLQAIFSAPPDKIPDIAPLVDRNIAVYKDSRHSFTRNFDPKEIDESLMEE